MEGKGLLISSVGGFLSIADCSLCVIGALLVLQQIQEIYKETMFFQDQPHRASE